MKGDGTRLCIYLDNSVFPEQVHEVTTLPAVYFCTKREKWLKHAHTGHQRQFGADPIHVDSGKPQDRACERGHGGESQEAVLHLAPGLWAAQSFVLDQAGNTTLSSSLPGGIIESQNGLG